MINIEIIGNICSIKGNKAANILGITDIAQEEVVEIIKRKPYDVQIIFIYDYSIEQVRVELSRELAKAIVKYDIKIDIEGKHGSRYVALSVCNYHYDNGRTDRVYIEVFSDKLGEYLNKEEIKTVIKGEIGRIINLNKCNIIYNEEIPEDNGEIYWDTKWIYNDITMNDEYSVYKFVYKHGDRIVQSM